MTLRVVKVLAVLGSKMMPKFTLVPAELFSAESAHQFLEEVVSLDAGEPLSFAEVPSVCAVLVYAGEQRPQVYDMLLSLCKIKEYNKVLIDIRDGFLSLVVAQGDNLLLCNAFPAADFTTAQYYIFMALNKLQINPEISTVYSVGALSAEQCISLCSYFKNAEVLQ